MEERFQVGVITTTHGVRGEVKVFPTTDDSRRFKKLKKVILDAKEGEQILEVEGVRFQKNLVLMKFKGFESINDIEKYKGCSLYVPREDAVSLEEDEYFVADLIGMEVFLEDGERFGKLTDVMMTGANDVYVIEMSDGQEVLIPAIRQCIREADPVQGKMVIHLLPGLLEEGK